MATTCTDELARLPKMEHLAQLAFDYMWLVMFAEEDMIDPDYSVRILEDLSAFVVDLSPAEQDALSAVGRSVRARLMAESDEHGYAPRSLVTEEQQRFLNAVISKEICSSDWWTA